MGSFAAARCVTALARSRLAQQWSGEPLVEIPPELRKDWLQTLDRAVEAMCTLGTGLAQAMNTLKALESETSDFPLNLPDLEQPVLNLATERDQRSGAADLTERATGGASPRTQEG